MRLQWFALPLLLVLIPTALLSFLAGQALQHRDAIWHERLAQDAASAVAAARGDIEQLLDAETRRVTGAVGDVLARGGTPERIGTLARQLASSRPLVDEVFLFMDPWGLIWPRDDGVLVDELRRRTSSADRLGRPLAFTHADAHYVFRSVPGRVHLLAGWRVDVEQLREQVTAMLERWSDRQFVLQVVDGVLRADDARVVTVGDTLNQDDAVTIRAVTPSATLAGLSLGPPFEDVELVAVLPSPEALERSVALERRFFGWGLALLVIGIVGGVAIFLWGALVQIRQARQRGEFLVGVSHDLRTPLASMRMLAETLVEGRVRPEQQHTFCATIVGECDHLSRLIERVLYLVRFGQGALAYHPRPVDLVELSRRAVSAMQAPARSLQFRAAEGVPRVRGDEPALMQVVTNLLDNAVKYGGVGVGEVPPNGDPQAHANGRVELTVDVCEKRRRWRGVQRFVRMAVHDDGMGISARERRRIFRQFYRSPRAHDRNVSGVGLGLALCRSVVHAHDGWIDVESELGKGSTFTVYLPAGDENSEA